MVLFYERWLCSKYSLSKQKLSWPLGNKLPLENSQLRILSQLKFFKTRFVNGSTIDELLCELSEFYLL
jgi:hypothetical protein